MNIFVAKLSFDTQSEDLQRVFEEYGEVSSVKIINDKLTGRSKGFGFVEMDNDYEARKGIEELFQGQRTTSYQGWSDVRKGAEPG